MTTQDAQNEAGRVDLERAAKVALVELPKARWSCSDDASGTALTLARQRKFTHDAILALPATTPPPEANAAQEGGGSEARALRTENERLRSILDQSGIGYETEWMEDALAASPPPSAPVDAGPVVTAAKWPPHADGYWHHDDREVGHNDIEDLLEDADADVVHIVAPWLNLPLEYVIYEPTSDGEDGEWVFYPTEADARAALTGRS